MSSSSSSQASSQSTADNRAAADNGAVSISAEGGQVSVVEVPDEAFDLGKLAISENAELSQFAVSTVAEVLGGAVRDTQGALYRTQQASRTESTQLAEQLIKIGIPAAALVYIVTRYRA